jgi:UDP-glucose 4-epimerase
MFQRPQSPSKRVLITGCAGLIGSSLTRQFLDLGWEVLGIDDFSAGWRERLPSGEGFEFVEGDVGSAHLWKQVFGCGPGFGALVHLAARVGVRSVLRDPEACRASNLRGVEAMLGAIGNLPVGRRPRVYSASTSEVYRDRQRPLSEHDATRCTSGVGRWAYAASKLRGEELIDQAAGDLPVAKGPVHLRFFNVVGPGQDAISGMVLANFVEQALSGEDLTVHGEGSQVRTFAHVDEIARVLAQLIRLGTCPAGPLNVGGVARTTIGELAHTVVRQARSRSRLRRTDPLQDCGANFEGIDFRVPELARLAQLGVTLPTASLEEIVADTLARHLELARPVVSRAQDIPCASPASSRA